MNKILRTCIALLGLGAAVPVHADPASVPATAARAPSSLERAKMLLSEGKAAEALALVEPIVAQAEADEAKDANASCPGLAANFLAAYMAQRNLNVTVSIENDWCESMLVQGYALGELKRFDEAALRLEKLVKHDPNNANYLAEYGFALIHSGQLDKALDAYKRAKSAASRFTDKAAKRHWRAVALRGIGYIAFEREQWDEAEKAYRESLKEAPGNAIALSELELIRTKRSN